MERWINVEERELRELRLGVISLQRDLRVFQEITLCELRQVKHRLTAQNTKLDTLIALLQPPIAAVPTGFRVTLT